MVAMHALNRTTRLRCLYMALPLILLSVPSQAQTFCNRVGSSIICDGENGSRTIQPLGRNGGVITDDRGNVSPYSNGTIIESESRSYRDAQRRSEERRREMIYGDWGESRRDRSRYDRDEER
jgi:hypothetical protein